ncbi:MAG: glycosyltransferase family 9 protein [Chitinophagales bacterium]
MGKKILIIRFSSIGDIVLTTPVIRCIKKQLPDSELHYLTKNIYASILMANPYIDKLLVFEKPLHKCIRTIAKEKYDCVIDLHNSLRSNIITSNLQLNTYVFNKINWRKWLMVKCKWNRLPDTHIVQRYLETAKELHVSDDGGGLDYFIPPGDRIQQNDMPDFIRSGYCVIVTGAAHNTKKLPMEKLMELCEKIHKPIVLIGGKEDLPTGEILARALPDKIWNTCGKFNINQSASLIAQSEKVYTPDTGMMHIAAAFQKPIISFWGNTIPEFGMYPYYNATLSLQQLRAQKQIREVAGLSCRPCSKIGFTECPHKHFQCMRAMDIADLE